MRENFEMRIIKMQLELEAKMYEQAQKMSMRMDMHDDQVAELEVQVAMMSKTIDAQDDCEDAYVVPHKDTGLHWHKLKSADPHDENFYHTIVPG